MTTTVEYVVYRHGSNGANQSMTEIMPIGIYKGAGKTATERRHAAQEAAEQEHTVYANQWLDAIPCSRVSAAEQEQAWEYQIMHQPTEASHQVGRIS